MDANNEILKKVMPFKNVFFSWYLFIKSKVFFKNQTNHLMEKGLSIPHHYLGLVTFFKSTPEKLTYHWKITILNRRYIFKWLFFHCHVSFWGCILWDARFSECHRHPKLRTGILQFHPSSLKEKHFRKKTTQKMAPFSKKKNGKNIPQNRWGFQEKKTCIFGEGFFTKKTKKQKQKTSLLSLSQPRPTTPPRPKSHRAGFRPAMGFFFETIKSVEVSRWWSLGATAKWKVHHGMVRYIFWFPPWLKTCRFLVYHVYIYIHNIPIPAL